MDYLYDGSFDGLLSAIYMHYYQEKATGIYPIENYQYNLITSSVIVETNQTNAYKVYEAIENKISATALRHTYHVFLSNHPQKENLILKYLQFGFRIGSVIDSYHTHPDVLSFLETCKKVSFEAHRFYGILRFVEANNYLYAAFEPDHNILILLAEHFSDRLAQENFIIHDKKRHLAVVYNRKEWYLTDFPKEFRILYSDNERFYQALWSKYFTHIGIEGRRNKRLQAQFVPHRYRKNMVEFKKILSN